MKEELYMSIIGSNIRKMGHSVGLGAADGGGLLDLSSQSSQGRSF